MTEDVMVDCPSCGEVIALSVDTFAGGQQGCTVVVSSPDVTPMAEDARSVKTIDVTSAELEVKLSGHEHRYTDQKNDFASSTYSSMTTSVGTSGRLASS